MQEQKKLIQALVVAKSKFVPALKDSTNPFHKSKYTSLNCLLDTVEPDLMSNGIIVLQPIVNGYVVTQLIHIESGEVMESAIELPNISDPQKIGSAITYYRRYTLTSLLSIRSADDDANKAKPKKSSKKWLSKDQYEQLLMPANCQFIKKYLDSFDMLEEQRIELERINKLPKES